MKCIDEFYFILVLKGIISKGFYHVAPHGMNIKVKQLNCRPLQLFQLWCQFSWLTSRISVFSLTYKDIWVVSSVVLCFSHDLIFFCVINCQKKKTKLFLSYPVITCYQSICIFVLSYASFDPFSVYVDESICLDILQNQWSSINEVAAIHLTLSRYLVQYTDFVVISSDLIYGVSN